MLFGLVEMVGRGCVVILLRFNVSKVIDIVEIEMIDCCSVWGMLI